MMMLEMLQHLESDYVFVWENRLYTLHLFLDICRI